MADLDPDIAMLLDRLNAGPAPDFATLTVPDLRVAIAGMLGALPDVLQSGAGVDSVDLVLPADCRCTARFYRPERHPAGGPCLVYFHGGEWGSCDLDTRDAARRQLRSPADSVIVALHDAMCRQLARGARIYIHSVAYRRAPEDSFPAAVEDALAAVAAVRSMTADLGIDAARIAVGGDSAGATLAAVVAQQAAAASQLLAAQVLIAPPSTVSRGSGPGRRVPGSGAAGHRLVPVPLSARVGQPV